MRYISASTVVLTYCLTLPAHAQQAVQWRVEDGGNGHWYQSISTSQSGWEAARAAAVAVGAELASVSSPAENEFVKSIARNPSLWDLGHGPWLGGFQIQGSEDFDSWRWTDGTPWGFSDWGVGEPNGSTTENFLHLRGDYPSDPNSMWWNDYSPSSWPAVRTAIIEWSADCNGDGIVDYGQILQGQLTDKDNNGVPDSCSCEAGTPCFPLHGDGDRLVIDPRSPSVSVLVSQDGPPSALQVAVEPTDVIALDEIGIRTECSGGENSALVTFSQGAPVPAGSASGLPEAELPVRIRAENAAGDSAELDAYVHRASCLPPRLMRDGSPLSLPSGWTQNSPSWGSQLWGASQPEDGAPPVVDYVRLWLDGVRHAADSLPSDSARLPNPLRFFATEFIRATPGWTETLGGTKLQVLAIAQNVENRRGNYTIGAVGCSLASLAIAVEAIQSSQGLAGGVSPGDLLGAMRQFAGIFSLRGISNAGQFRGFKCYPGNCDIQVPRFTGADLQWSAAQAWYRFVGIGITITLMPAGAFGESTVQKALDACKAIVVFDGGHWTVITKWRRDENGEMDVYNADPFGTSVSGAWVSVGSTKWNLWKTANTYVDSSKPGITFKVVSASGAPSQGLVPFALDLSASAPGAVRMMVTDPAGVRTGDDPASNDSYSTSDRGIGLEPPPDLADDPPETDEEWADLASASSRVLLVSGTLREGRYVIDLDTADTVATVRWRQEDGQSFELELVPTPTEHGGRVEFDIFVTGPFPCRCDFDHDGGVNGTDLAWLITQWGPVTSSTTTDLNADGIVDGVDLARFLAEWGPCPN